MTLETGSALLDAVIRALESYGYLIVFGITVFENLFVVGSATPGETAVVAASFVAAQGQLELPIVWLASVLGTVVGSNVSYWFGYFKGRDALDALAHRLEGTRLGRLVGIHRGSMEEAEAYFSRYGSKTIFFSRFAVGLKNFMPVVAGASKMGVWWFELWTFLGAIAYTSAMCAIGWFLGRSFDRAVRVAGGISWVGLVIALGVLVTVVVLRARRRPEAEAPEGEE